MKKGLVIIIAVGGLHITHRLFLDQRHLQQYG
jgi:hypothetical protein